MPSPPFDNDSQLSIPSLTSARGGCALAAESSALGPGGISSVSQATESRAKK